MDAAVRTSGLTRRYGGRAVVDGLDLEVPRRSLFALLGPNGAGKTTTFAMICGFVRPHSGRIEVLGQPSSRLPLRRISALPQDAHFHPERTVWDAMIFLAELQGLPPPRARSEATRVLEVVGLWDSRHLRGRELSHGLAKRFGVAQAFLGEPELVLLDEPTEGLDPRNAHAVREMIRQMARTATVLVSSHNLAEVEDLCDHAAILDRGRLVTQAPMADLTGQDQHLFLRLAEVGHEVATALASLPGVRSVETEEDGHRLHLMLRPTEGQSIDRLVTDVLRVVIDRGALIGSVTRGRRLEERFLELT
ncbi:MAG TPA: ABC transporter ATP-binding protein [Myxococcota bacterium]|nr:ABC transporter ATP-binding protein [Myxococcota bacterium]HQK50357.1 ABC transporter ATP-binding protein [Myxococcota bacterium]